MFLALVIMLPLICLTLAAAGEALISLCKLGYRCERLGQLLWNLAAAGVLFALLPPIFNRGDVLRPLFDIALALGLGGAVFVRAGHSPVPHVWFALACFGSVATLSIWTIAPL